MKRIVSILLLVAQSLLAQADSSSFFFVQLSDPQFGMYPTGKDFVHERENVERAMAWINRAKPDFVVVTGDLVNTRGDGAQVRAFFNEFGTVDPSIRLLLAAGNHDVGNSPTDTSIGEYHLTFGPDFFSFEWKGIRFIILNSSLFKDPSGARADAHAQEQWLKSELSGHDASPTIVFQHHPWFVENIGETNSYHNLPSKIRKEYLDLMIDRGVTHVFAGHLHHNAVGKYRTLQMISTGPIGMPLGTDPPGLRIIKVTNGKVSHRYFSLKEIERSTADKFLNPEFLVAP